MVVFKSSINGKLKLAGSHEKFYECECGSVCDWRLKKGHKQTFEHHILMNQKRAEKASHL